MRRFCVMAFVFLASAFSFSTVTVSGNLVDPATGAVTNRAKVVFTIRGCGGNQPRIAGTGSIVPSSYTFTPVAGAISGTVYDSLTEISCGGSVGATWYGITIYYDGRPGPEVPYNVTGASFNLNSATPNSTSPVASAPTGDSTYARLDGGNTPFTGSVSVKRLNNIRYADQFTGANACVKIAAAWADLPSTGGTVDARAFEGSQTCSVNPLSGISKPLVLLLGAATYNAQVQWNSAGQSNVIVIGSGRSATSITALAGTFPTSTAIVNIGDGATLVFGTRYENLGINASNIAGSTTLSASGLNEQSGGRYLKLVNYLTNGLKIDGTAVTTQHYKFYDIELAASASATNTDGILTVGFHPGAVIDTATIGVQSGVNVQTSGAHVTSVAGSGAMNFRNIHVEQAADGIFYDTSSRGTVYGLDLKTGTNVLHTNTTSQVIATDVSQVSGVTNTIQADTQSFTNTDINVPLYVQGNNVGGQQVFSWGGSASSFGNVVGTGNNVRFALQSTTANGNSNLSFIDSSNNGYLLQGSPNSGNPQLFFRTVAAGVPSTVATCTGGFCAFNGGVSGASLRSQTANVAAAGAVRLAKNDPVNFRNNANGADVNGISLDGSDVVQVGGAAGFKAGSSGSAIPDTRELLQNAHSCGTTTTCANTANGSNRIIFGSVALSSGTPSTATVASITPFTSTSSYFCTATPVGATAAIAAGGIAVTNVSSSSFTLTGPNTVTTVINYSCTGN